MKWTYRQLDVFHRFLRKTEPVSLKTMLQELRERFRWTYPERTVRRWIAKMEQEGLIQRFGKKRGTKYQTVQLTQHQGFDEIRVRYRQERRALIREIVVGQLIGKELKQFATEKAKAIPKNDRSHFLRNLWEDLEELNEIRMAGLGITREQLNAWLQLRSRP